MGLVSGSEEKGILRARGGSSLRGKMDAVGTAYSPRTRR